MACAIILLPSIGLAAPVRVPLAEAAWVTPGARVEVLATTGAGDARATRRWLDGCVEVSSVMPDAVSLGLDAAATARVKTLPADAGVRLALCPSEADPLSRTLGPDRRAVPLSSEVPEGLSRWLRAGDRVDLLVTLGDETVTFLQQAEVARDAWNVTGDQGPSATADPRRIALAVQADQLEQVVHAEATGPVSVALVPAVGAPAPEVGVLVTGRGGPTDRFAAILPAGLRVVAVPGPPLGLAPFNHGASYVDVLASAGGREILLRQAVFTLTPDAADPAALILLVTPQMAEEVTQAARTGGIAVTLRNDLDITFVDDPRAAAVRPPPEPEPAIPTTRIAMGARGLVLPLVGSAREGDVVTLRATGCTVEVGPLTVIASKDAAALVQATVSDALKISAAARTCERVVVAR